MDESRKRKKPLARPSRKGIATGQYMRFISKTLDEMNKFPKMRDDNTVMNNAPIHTSDSINGLIKMSYISFPIFPWAQSYWRLLVYCGFTDTEDLKTRTLEASESVTWKTLYYIDNHSVYNFKKCLNNYSDVIGFMAVDIVHGKILLISFGWTL